MALQGARTAAHTSTPTRILPRTPALPPFSVSALSDDTKSSPNGSAETENERSEAAVPSTTSSPACEAATDATSADAATCDSGRQEDGYVTPPLRVGYPSEYVQQQQYQSAYYSQQPHHHLLLLHQQHQTSFLKSHGDSALTSMNPGGGVGRDGHASGIFTPILYAAQPLGGMLSPSGTKRKRLDMNGGKDDDTLLGERIKTPKRKASSDFLRKGQWTTTEEKFAGALIDAFEEGYLPINMGVRLRGYLAVQLQCDPMRVSKKLCGGSVDGKKVPKNYGQKKYKSRRKQLWDQDEADRTIATLEKLMHDLWQESGTPKPAFLTLSSTRESVGEECNISGTPAMTNKKESVPSLPEIKQEEAAAASLPSTVKTEPGSSLPIIYLNLSKKLKSNGASSTGSSSSDLKSDSKASLEDAASTSTSSNAGASASTAKNGEAWNVDGDSLQAAYELLKLFQA